MKWIKASFRDGRKDTKHTIELSIEFTEECTRAEAEDFIFNALCKANKTDTKEEHLESWQESTRKKFSRID